MPSIISHKKRFVFVHVPKSGGTSVVQALGRYEDRAWQKWLWRRAFPRLLTPAWRRRFRREFNLTHMRAAELKRLVADYEQLYRFGFVRNPWDRHVSLYEYGRQTPARLVYEQRKRQTFDEYLAELRESPTGRQASWFYDDTGTLLVDFVGRFETLKEDFRRACDAIGVEAELPHLNPSRRRDYRTYYSDEARELVARIDRRDIELFGYTF